MDNLSAEPTGAAGRSSQAATLVVSRKGVFIAVVAALGAVGAAYGTGRLQGAAQVSRIEARAEEESKQSGKQTDRLRAKLADARSKLSRLEARRQLHMALVALDQRNFGIAQQHVGRSGRLLEGSQSPPNSELGRLGQTMVSKRLVATEDLAAQRRELLAWAARLDELVPPTPP
jgi:hypothetical protein